MLVAEELDIEVVVDLEETMTAAITITTITTRTAANAAVETPLLCIFIEKTICSSVHNAIYPLGGAKRGA